MVSARMVEHIGRVLSGRYRLIAPLGAGGSGRVYLADDVTLRRRVAVKVLHEALAGDDAFLRRFRAEAQAAAALSHPNVMAVYDWGDDDGPYLVLEHLGGGSLRGLLDAGHRLTPSQALVVGLEASRALDVAHRRGIVHRDVKPSNLLFDSEGRLRIADFGLARALAEAAWTEPSGVVVGSARYASPEQARGDLVDGKSDVYALALVLVESVTGEVPFAADTTVATLMARVDRPLPVPDELGLLRPVLEEAGRPDPAERPDAAAFGQALFDLAARLPKPRPLPLAPPKLTPTNDAPIVEPTVHAGAPATTAEPGSGAASEGDHEATVAVPAVPDGDHADEEVTVVSAPRRRRPWRWLMGVVLAAAVLAGGAAAYAYLRVPTHEVPDVIGEPEDQALATLRDEQLDFDVQVSPQYVDGTEAGTVISLDPPPGSQLREGGRLTVVVSLGPTPVNVPELSGLTVEEATTALEAVGLEVGAVEERHDEQVEAGRVLTWVHGGTERPEQVPKGQPVDLAVSIGPAPRTVPELTGLSYDDAAARLQELGLEPVRSEAFSSQVASGLVASTDPGAGATVARGETVTVVVSKGPDLVTVPRVSGRSLDDARRMLEAAGLRVREIEGDPNRKVAGTDPPDGERVERGTAVVVFMQGFSDD